MATTEEELPLFFGEWLKRRHRALGLTQVELAKRISCSLITLQKIEAGERRPSKQLAGLLAQALGIPASDQASFIQVARGELGLERLPPLVHPASQGSHPAAKASSLPGNLPRALTPFIGREPEIAALGQLLQDPSCSLLTVTGPGGIGKTRLAIEAARHSQDLFPDGVWFVPLGSLNSPVQIIPAIAEALAFKFQDPTNPQTQLLRYLHPQKVLLILDNAEHLLDGVGRYTEILKNCPQVKLLVTSRERLSLLSEWVFEVQGLPVPPDGQVEQFEAYSSVALFLQSAQRVQAGFELREADRQWVLQICQIMEGMPLGIELSAAWVGLLSCQEIAQEIEHNIEFLSVSMRDLPERHRSLRATLNHSWQLLNDEERLILSRLAVFHGSFRREASGEICGANLAILSSLQNKSLLHRTEKDFYSLHEIIRQYAELKLKEDPIENERIKDRHAYYFVQYLSKCEDALQGSRQVDALNDIAKVIDDLYQGWLHMVTNDRPKTGRKEQFPADLLHSALFSISLFYEMRCRSLEAIRLFTESIQNLKTALTEFEETEDRSRMISVLGHITAYLGLHQIYLLEYGKAGEYLEEAIQLLEKSQSRSARAQAQLMLATIEAIRGRLQENAAMIAQSREVFREEGETWWYALSTINLATTYISLGKHQESEALFQEGFRLVEPGDLRLGMSLRNGFAYVVFLNHDFTRAEQLMQENLQLSYQLGNARQTAAVLFDLGRVALATQRIEQAIEYIQKNIQLLCEASETPNLAMQRIYLGKCYAARNNLSDARDQFRQVIQIGQALDRFPLVCWGLINIARTYLAEGRSEEALEISLLLRRCPTEYKRIEEERIRLLADLQAVLPEEMETALQKVDSDISLEQAKADVLAYAKNG